MYIYIYAYMHGSKKKGTNSTYIYHLVIICICDVHGRIAQPHIYCLLIHTVYAVGGNCRIAFTLRFMHFIVKLWSSKRWHNMTITYRGTVSCTWTTIVIATTTMLIIIHIWQLLHCFQHFQVYINHDASNVVNTLWNSDVIWRHRSGQHWPR